VGLAEWADAYPGELSGGMQQRVGLARALATEARIMLMDEPFSALDPLIRVHMQQELLKIQERLARTILFITHDLDEAMYIGDRIAIMDAGKIVQIGTPEEILTNPRTEYVARFVEHADPTNVITARTIMLPFDGGWFETVDSAGDGRWLARRGQPHVTYHLSASGGFEGMAVEGEAATVRSLNAVLDEIEKSGTQGRRRHDVALSCTPETVLGDLLRGRTYATLPAVVIDGDGTARGVIDETELIGGILEKRGTANTAAGAA
jgi:glycine betaine/proline transport system ATP-binding protein